MRVLSPFSYFAGHVGGQSGRSPSGNRCRGAGRAPASWLGGCPSLDFGAHAAAVPLLTGVVVAVDRLKRG
jgi:hypothetical protein